MHTLISLFPSKKFSSAASKKYCQFHNHREWRNIRYQWLYVVCWFYLASLSTEQTPSSCMKTGTHSQNVQIFEVETYAHVRSLGGQIGIINCMVTSPDGQFLISGSFDNTTMVLNTNIALFPSIIRCSLYVH